MSYTYSSFVSTLSNMVVWPSTDARFQAVLPGIIDDTEQRVYRELSLIATQVADTTTFSLNTRLMNLPSNIGTFIVVDRVNVITPSSQTNPELGTRNALVPVSEDVLDMLWPSSTGSTVPQYFAMRSQDQIIVGPYPDAAYTVEVIGEQRPAPLSASNTTTLLTVFLPDLFMAGALVFTNGAMKNFGIAADDPKSAITWESHFQTLLKSAQVEEARKMFTSAGWSSKEPAPLATPPRS
jgi:hypothetical protein